MGEPTRLRHITPEAESPLPKCGKEVIRTMFSAANHETHQGAQMVFENDVGKAIIDQCIAYLDANKNEEVDTNEHILYAFDIIIFISKDATFLQEAFEKTTPCADEVCLYIEDNTGDLFSEGISWIKIGHTIQKKKKVLHKLFNSGQKAQGIQLDNIIQDDSLFTELIQNGSIANIPRSTLLSLISGINYLNYPAAIAFKELAQILLKLTSWTREKVSFDEKDWNPEHQKAKNKNNINEHFTPYFFPHASPDFQTTEKMDIRILLPYIESGIKSKSAVFQSVLKSKMKSEVLELEFFNALEHMEFYFSLEKRLINLINEQSLMLFRFSNQIANEWVKMKNNSLINLNAFLCGLWNSLIEVVLGFVDFIAYLLKFLALSNTFNRDLNRNLRLLLEFMDELFDAVNDIDIAAIYEELLTLFAKLNFNAFKSYFTEARLGYLAGGILGFIIEIAIGLLFSGGTASFAAVLRKINKATGSELLEKLKKHLHPINKLNPNSIMGKELAAKLINTIRIIIKFFRSGTDEVITFLRAFADDLANLIRLSKEQLVQVMRLLKITKYDITEMENLGVFFTNYKRGSATACKIFQ